MDSIGVDVWTRLTTPVARLIANNRLMTLLPTAPRPNIVIVLLVREKRVKRGDDEMECVCVCVRDRWE